MEWIREFTEQEIRERLNNDTALICEACGLEVLISLWQNFPGINIYPSTKPLNELRRLYIRRKYNGSNRKQLAIELGVSEQFVHNALSQGDREEQGQDLPLLRF